MIFSILPWLSLERSFIKIIGKNSFSYQRGNFVSLRKLSKKNIKIPNKDSTIHITKENDIPVRKVTSSFWLYKAIFCSLCCASLWAIYELGQPETDHRGELINDDDLNDLTVPQQYLQRMWRLLHYYQMMMREPISEKLLPDPVLPPYYQPPYTLVLEIRDVLVHPDWTYHTLWRFKKRPGVEFFLQQCSKYFEIIVFTTDRGTTAFPILDDLDPRGYIQYRLMRGAMQSVDGHLIKDLQLLNRNLKRVIIVDWNVRHISPPTNTFAIPRWLGNDNDDELFTLTEFLETIAVSSVEDVRDVLQYYSQFDNPLQKFKENQRTIQDDGMEKPPRPNHWSYKFMGR